MSVPLSVLIITGNEEINIRQALDNVCGWANEVFVIDSFSTDRTVEIAREMGAQVVQNPWPGYSAQKNWALEHLPFRNEWVFVLDADEFLSDELKQEVAQILAEGGRGFDGFHVKWRLIFYGKWIRHCGWYPAWGLRFFKHRLGRYEKRPVDEHIILQGKVGQCRHDIIHRDLHDMAYWISKHIRYAQLNTVAYEQLDRNEGADERIRPNLFGSQAERRRFLKERVFRFLPARAFWYFLYRYFFRLGFLDGPKGLVFCLMHAIFVEFRSVMEWEKMHLHELGYSSPCNRNDVPSGCADPKALNHKPEYSPDRNHEPGQVAKSNWMRLSANQVVAYQDGFAEYPRLAPFHPSERYPEYGFSDLADAPNHAYDSVRECFRLAGLDAARFGTAEWNPLGELMKPGETVVLKPNMVKESHPRDPEGWQYVLTHGSVIRAAADYIWRAIGSEGKLYLADAPQTDSSWDGLVSVLGLDSICEHYRRHGLNFQLVDLRREEWTSENDVIVARRKLAGDPNGAVVLNLGEASEFFGHNGAGHYYGADYDAGEVNRHHTDGKHEYLLAGTVMKADVVFSLPKLKTHKKAGITVSLKNLVGVNADKNWLPHHTEGNPKLGGDEHPNPGAKHRLERRAASMLRHMALRFPVIGPQVLQRARRVGASVFGDTESVIRSGNWFGNDTIWRMCLDLNKLVLYGGVNGELREPLPENRKRHYVLVDGLIAGEGSGPLNPDPVRAGTLIFGSNPPSVDAACAWLMGLDPEKIPIVRQAFQVRQYPLVDHDWQDIELISNVDAWNRRLVDVSEDSTFHFEPHFGWKGQVERQTEVLAR